MLTGFGFVETGFTLSILQLSIVALTFVLSSQKVCGGTHMDFFQREVLTYFGLLQDVSLFIQSSFLTACAYFLFAQGVW